ncbi:hypothetical protein O1611_g5408 [Lasiodiplodia mahajangana]|uniref:Uncharacterized protein n=1 Tax=Lasiodiplodia mahajangana TaxID=1108764 RepID=A0ACC2JLJ4_9PEZI|nr:hypothetical protein O1611_g5408 [Lasiodiplodia mahajangana]
MEKLQQVRVGVDHCPFASAANGLDAKKAHTKEHAAYQTALLSKCPAHLWSKGSHRAASPRPILVGKNHQQRIRALSEALTTALTSIVKRWWSDEQAGFFERMPLASEEEELLKWLEDQVSQGKLKDYSECRGSWRPDFLIEEHVERQNGEAVEKFLITEINARFSFNGIFYVSYGQEVLGEMVLRDLKLYSTTEPKTMLGSLQSLFNPAVPLHLLIDEEAGIDIHMFVHDAQHRFGITPRMIKPSDLRLEPSQDTDGGYQLCCLAQGPGTGQMLPAPRTFINDKGETWEEIRQVGLELRQHELFALPKEMLRHISLVCFNDLRTLLLVHDKRMLGIVKQELGHLVQSGVLTPAQARVLDEGIVDTYLPNSLQLHTLLQISIASPSLKNEYILKPIRGGKGAGIIFGDDLTANEWECKLKSLHSQVPFSGSTYVVQRRVKHCLYDLVLPASEEKVRYPLVGTFHIMNGTFRGLGIWRASAKRICAISSGGSMLCSVSRSA